MTNTDKYIVIPISSEDAGSRLDRWFKRHYPQINHGFIEKSIRKGLIRLADKKTASNARIEEGQRISIAKELLETSAAPSKKSGSRTPKISDAHKEMLLGAVLYKDNDIIVINKPAGLAVQGGSKVTICLDDMLDVLSFEKTERPKLVHRLDKDTSGILLLARNSKAATLLTQAFQHKNIQKTYWALVLGRAPELEGSIHMPLIKATGAKAGAKDYEQVRQDVEKGEEALTFYRVISTARNVVSWLELRPVTGRTHQLRVHCQSIGAPIIGDGKYGGKETFLKGVAPKMHLHARQLTLPNLFGKKQTFVAPLPSHMKDSWKLFGFQEEK